MQEILALDQAIRTFNDAHQWLMIATYTLLFYAAWYFAETSENRYRLRHGLPLLRDNE